MRTIWKYEIPLLGTFEIEMPGDREFLSLATQYDVPYIWVAVDPESGTFIRKFHLVGTGNPIPEETQLHHELVFRGSFELNGGLLVFHLFEEVVRASR